MNCKICGNAENNKDFDVKEMMFGIQESFKYMKCGFCGCLQINEVPKDMQKYYPANYYSYSSIENNPIFKNVVLKYAKGKRDYYTITGKGIIGRLLSFIKKNGEFHMLSELGLGRQSRMLDVGCGSGGKLYSLVNAGFKNVLGVDPFIASESIRYKIGLEIQKKNIFQVSGKWDLIMFNHSFEHLDQPNDVLKKVYDLLSDKGVCIIRIPVSDSFAFEKYGVNWVQLDAPRHFYLHTAKNMDFMADRAGLRVSKTDYDGDDFQFWGSEQYMKGINLMSDRSYAINKEKSGFTEADIEGYKIKARELNSEKKGDAAAFYLVKK